MNTANLSIKRPIFLTSIVILMVILGTLSAFMLGVDLFPPTDFPIVTITTTYPGANPDEVEQLISKPIEEQVSTISGVKRVSSRNMESISYVFVQFTYETDIKYAEQKVREMVSLARKDLPQDLPDDPLVKQFDIFATSVAKLAVVTDKQDTATFDLVKDRIKPMLEQLNGVGEVKIVGALEREIQVELDRKKMNEYQVSALSVAEQLKNTGVNVPIGNYNSGPRATSFQAVGQFTQVDEISRSVISFSGDYLNAVTVDKIGTVNDTIKDTKTKAYLYYPKVVDEQTEKQKALSKIFIERSNKAKQGNWEKQPCIYLDIYKQSGANTVDVVHKVKKQLESINQLLENRGEKARIVYVFDSAKFIEQSVHDVKVTIVLGIILAIVVVYLFLGNMRSTIITGIAIPNSLIGAFVLMYVMGFTINIVSLMALSLTVGLLVDDAIVVRENIFKKMEKGMGAKEASILGTKEVMLAVIATSLTVMAVFLPISFMSGVVGKIFRQFGLTVVFAMAVSLFDALFIAPMLSAYFVGKAKKNRNFVVSFFVKFQDWLERKYEQLAGFAVNRPGIILLATLVVLIGSCGAFAKLPKAFQPDSEEMEYQLAIKMPTESSLDGTENAIKDMADKISHIPEVCYLSLQCGTDEGNDNEGNIGIFLLPKKERSRSVAVVKEEIRAIVKPYLEKGVTASIGNYGDKGGEQFMLNIKGEDLDVLKEYTAKLYPRIAQIKDLADVDISYKTGRPQFQVVLDDVRMKNLGVNHWMAGSELRYQIEGGVVGKLHQNGLEYDIRLRLKPDQRNLRKDYAATKVPNMHGRLIPLSAVSSKKDTVSPALILREDRARTIQITASIAPGGATGNAMTETLKILNKELPPPKGVTYGFRGELESYEEMNQSMGIAFLLACAIIFLVLASLYESFFTPFTILMALPPALSGAAFALLFTGKQIDMFSMIGMIMLLGLVTKNAILLVDFAIEHVREGMPRKDAIIAAGKARLRPILMTTFAMIAGTMPMALGIGEAAQYRMGMGITIVGGLVVSTVVTLLVVPAVFEYIDIFREFIEKRFRIKEQLPVVSNAKTGSGKSVTRKR